MNNHLDSSSAFCLWKALNDQQAQIILGGRMTKAELTYSVFQTKSEAKQYTGSVNHPQTTLAFMEALTIYG